MPVVSMKELLESGVHFGHQTRRWDPRMKPFIYTQRKGIHILDLQKTVEYVERAYEYVRDQAARGAVVLFVGTKKQAQQAIEEAAKRCGMPYVNRRWLGGLLTNFETVMRSKRKMEECEAILGDAERQKNYTKKELQHIRKTRDRIANLLAGIREMERLPDILFIIDPVVEETAVAEARRLRIPIVAVVDTNCNPDVIDYPIPGNDDAIRSVTLFASIIANAVINGRREFQERSEGVEMPAQTELSNVAYVSRLDRGTEEDLKEMSFSAEEPEPEGDGAGEDAYGGVEAYEEDDYR